MAFNYAEDDVKAKVPVSPVDAAFGAVINELGTKLATAIAFIEKVCTLHSNIRPEDAAVVRRDARAVLGEIDSQNPLATPQEFG